jgi:hypothetical protein
MRTLAAILCALSCALISGCGSIGEPLYPALHIPARITDLSVVQHGDNLNMEFTIAPLTTEGLPVKGIGEVELRVGPGPSNGWNLDEWKKNATRVDVPAPDQPGPIHAVVPAGKFVGSEVVIGVRVTNTKGRDAGWSDFKTFDVQPPLAAPMNFHVAPGPNGVQLMWAASGPSQFRIYRKTAQEQKPVLLASATEPNYTDISAEYGKTYQYSIQAVRDRIESDVVGPEIITPIDKFAPATPTGLTASVGIGAIELAWTRNTESDFKEYRILRSEEGGPLVEIARGLAAPTYSDRNIQTGKRYRYQVLAVDQTGNASTPCEPVEIIAP